MWNMNLCMLSLFWYSQNASYKVLNDMLYAIPLINTEIGLLCGSTDGNFRSTAFRFIEHLDKWKKGSQISK